jgi:hypothetical protein
MWVQPVVIGGSDSAELDNFHSGKETVLCIRSSASLRQGNFDLRAFKFSNKKNATKRTGRFLLKAELLLLFVRLQGKGLEERSKQGRQRSATFRGESGGGWGLGGGG